MAQRINLKVQKRKIIGRKVKQLRRDRIIPANIYGKDIKSLAVKLPVKDFHEVFKKAGETNIIDLQVDKEKKSRTVLVGNIHRHPVTDYYLHVDFHQIDPAKKVAVNIPVELTGEAPAVFKGGILVHQINEVEVEALPANLPNKFTLDISKLEEIGQSLTLKDLKVDTKKVNILVEDMEEVVVQVQEQKELKEEPESEPETPAEGEEVEAQQDEAKEDQEKK